MHSDFDVTSHPAAPSSAEERFEDEKLAIELTPDIIEHLQHLQRNKRKLRNKTLVEIAAFAIKHTASRQNSLTKYEVTSRCGACKKKSQRCKCPPDVLARLKARRDAEERAEEIRREQLDRGTR